MEHVDSARIHCADYLREQVCISIHIRIVHVTDFECRKVVFPKVEWNRDIIVSIPWMGMETIFSFRIWQIYLKEV